MSHQLWARLSAALAGAVITLAPGASTYAAPAQPDTTPVISSAADGDRAPAVARGWDLTVNRNGVILWASSGNWNSCHKGPSQQTCNDRTTVMNRNEGIFGHCKIGSNHPTWVFASYRRKVGTVTVGTVGYVYSGDVGPRQNLNRLPICRLAQ